MSEMNAIGDSVETIALSWACEPDPRFLSALREMQELIAKEYADGDQSRLADGIAIATDFARACARQRNAMHFDSGINISRSIH